MNFKIETIEIIVDRNTIELNEISNNVFGEIYVRIGDKYFFPGIGWTDFVVNLLLWWLKSLYKIIKSEKEKSFELQFMDGPYLIKGKKLVRI